MRICDAAVVPAIAAETKRMAMSSHGVEAKAMNGKMKAARKVPRKSMGFTPTRSESAPQIGQKIP